MEPDPLLPRCSLRRQDHRQLQQALAAQILAPPGRRFPRSKYVYVARNPWDVCVSTFHMVSNLSVYRFQDGTFDQFFEAFVAGDFGYGTYFEHVSSGYALRNAHNVLFLTYEELKRDTCTAVLKLADFLGESYGKCLRDSENGLLETLLRRLTPENTASILVMNLRPNQAPEWESMKARNKMTCRIGYGGDKTKYGIVRKAKIGDWRNHFKPQQLRRLEAAIRVQGEKASFMDLWNDIREEALLASRF